MKIRYYLINKSIAVMSNVSIHKLKIDLIRNYNFYIKSIEEITLRQYINICANMKKAYSETLTW